MWPVPRFRRPRGFSDSGLAPSGVVIDEDDTMDEPKQLVEVDYVPPPQRPTEQPRLEVVHHSPNGEFADRCTEVSIIFSSPLAYLPDLAISPDVDGEWKLIENDFCKVVFVPVKQSHHNKCPCLDYWRDYEITIPTATAASSSDATADDDDDDGSFSFHFRTCTPSVSRILPQEFGFVSPGAHSLICLHFRDDVDSVRLINDKIVRVTYREGLDNVSGDSAKRIYASFDTHPRVEVPVSLLSIEEARAFLYGESELGKVFRRERSLVGDLHWFLSRLKRREEEELNDDRWVHSSHCLLFRIPPKYMPEPGNRRRFEIQIGPRVRKVVITYGLLEVKHHPKEPKEARHVSSLNVAFSNPFNLPIEVDGVQYEGTVPECLIEAVSSSDPTCSASDPPPEFHCKMFPKGVEFRGEFRAGTRYKATIRNVVDITGQRIDEHTHIFEVL